MSRDPKRQIAPHVQAAIAAGQAKTPTPVFQAKAGYAPHVQAAIVAGQAKTPTPTVQAKVGQAPHVGAAIAAGQAKIAVPEVQRKHGGAPHVQAAFAARQQPKIVPEGHTLPNGWTTLQMSSRRVSSSIQRMQRDDGDTPNKPIGELDLQDLTTAFPQFRFETEIYQKSAYSFDWLGIIRIPAEVNLTYFEGILESENAGIDPFEFEKYALQRRQQNMRLTGGKTPVWYFTGKKLVIPDGNHRLFVMMVYGGEAKVQVSAKKARDRPVSEHEWDMGRGRQKAGRVLVGSKEDIKARAIKLANLKHELDDKEKELKKLAAEEKAREANKPSIFSNMLSFLSEVFEKAGDSDEMQKLAGRKDYDNFY